MAMQLVPPPARHPRVVIFTALPEDQRARHEEVLRSFGFDPTTRDMPKHAPLVEGYEAVLVVGDHADYGMVGRVELAAKRTAGARLFRVTKKTSGQGWLAVERWASSLGLSPNRPAPQEAPVASSAPTPAEPDPNREAAQWQKLAEEYDAQRQQAEDALAGVRAELAAAEKELGEQAARALALARSQIASQGELEGLRKETQTLRDQRNENDRRARTAQKELAALRDELRQAHAYADAAAFAEPPQPGGDLEKARRIASSLWDLVDTEQMDLEEAFIRLAKALGIEK